MARRELRRTLEALLGLCLVLTGLFIARMRSTEQNPCFFAISTAVFRDMRITSGQNGKTISWVSADKW